MPPHGRRRSVPRAQRERASSYPQPLPRRDGLPGLGRGPGWYRRQGMKGRSSPQTVKVLGIGFHHLSRALAQLAPSLAALVLNPKAVRHPLKENMAGVDLTEEMLAHLDRARSRIFLLGGSEKEIQGARRWVEGRFPGPNGVG